MKKTFTIITVLASLAALSGVLIFAADDSGTTNFKLPLYCKDDHGIKKCFCVNDDLLSDPAGTKMMESLYGDVKDLWTKFPEFSESLTPSALFLSDSGKKLQYWNPSSIYMDKDGEQVRYKYSIDVNTINVADNDSSACVFQREKINPPNDWVAFRTWIFSQGEIFSKGIQSVGDNNYARPIQLFNEKGDETSYFLGGYSVSQFLDVSPLKKVYSFLSANDKKAVAFYPSPDIVVPDHETYDYESTTDGGICLSRDENGNAISPPYEGCRVTHTYHYYKILEPSIESMLSAYDIEQGINVNGDMIFFLSQNGKMYYQTFKKYTKLPEKTVQDNGSNTYYWLEGDYNHAPYLSKEYYVALNPTPQEIKIPVRHSFDIRFINDKKAYLALSGGGSKTITSDLKNDGSQTETFFDDLYFFEYKDGKINATPTKSYHLPKAQKNVKLTFSDDLKKFFLFGGNLENIYYFLNTQGKDGNFDINTFGNSWTKIILGSTENEFSDLPSVTEYGIPQSVDVFAKGMNFTYQPYGAVTTFEYPKKLSFNTNMTGITPTVVVRVWRCGSALRPKICKEYAPRFIIGSANVPIYFSHARGTKSMVGNNKIFSNQKIITSVTPLVTLTKDNVISFVGNAQVADAAKTNPLEELRLHSVYFIEDGEKLLIPPLRVQDKPTGKTLEFHGFDGNFFNAFFKVRPVNHTEETGISINNFGNKSYKAAYDDSNGGFSSSTKNYNGCVTASNDLCDFSQFSQFLFLYELPREYNALSYSGEKPTGKVIASDLQNTTNLSFFWNKKFSPGQHRVHMLVTATHSLEMLNHYKVMGNLIHGTNGSPMRKGAGPHSWSMEPSDLGMDAEHSQVNGPFKVYYQAYTIDFYVPEITNFSSKVGFVPVKIPEVLALGFSNEKINSLFTLDPKDKTKATFQAKDLEELYGSEAFYNLDKDEKSYIIDFWEKNESPFPTEISSIRPVFSLEKALAFNTIDWYMGDNVTIMASELPANHPMKKALQDDPKRHVLIPMGLPLNDLPLNMPQLNDKAISTDGNTKNVLWGGAHTLKAHFMRSNRDGEANFASQERLYSLDSLSDTQKKELEKQGVSSSYYKIFSVVTDEQGNKIGAAPVYVRVINDQKIDAFHVYETKRNTLIAAWRPFEILKFIQDGKPYFTRADKDGNITVTFDSMHPITLQKLDDQNNWVDLLDDTKKPLTITLKENIIPYISNYINGDVIYNSEPLFEGTAQPNSPVFYRIYWRQKDTNLPLLNGYFEERDERYRVQIEYGATQSDASGHFMFMPEKYLSAPINDTQIYYVEVGASIDGIEDALWKQSSVLSLRYQKQSLEEPMKAAVILPGSIGAHEDYLRFTGGSYIFGLYSATDKNPAMLRFTTPARVKLRAGQLIVLPEKSQMTIVSDNAQGALFSFPKGAQIIHASNKVPRVLREGIYSQYNDAHEAIGLVKDDEVIAPNKGGLISVVSDEVELILPANTEIFAGKIPDTFTGDEKLFQVEALLKEAFENTRFVFSNLESVYQNDCALTEGLNPTNTKVGTVERCKILSEVVLPKTRDPKLFYPHNGERLKEDDKIELMGTAWPNSVLQIIIASQHVGTVTSDKNGRFYWKAPVIYDFQTPGTDAYMQMQQHGIGIDIFDLEQKTSRVGILISFSPDGNILDNLNAGLNNPKDIDTTLFTVADKKKIKDLFLLKMQSSDSTEKDGYNRIPLFQSFWDRVRHFLDYFL